MSKPLTFASVLLVSTCLLAPAALAQTSAPGPASGLNSAPPTQTPDQEPDGQVDVSIPGGDNDIVVVGRARQNIQQNAAQVVSVLSSEDIARTGEGDIAGALQRVTGLSVVGNGFVYVRGLGDRYSLALLNGSPLPSPEPLKRVVPLDIFPTDIIASSLVQKSYSANFPGEFGGGVINLTTKATPTESFLSISGGISGDTETTGQLGYFYYGSPYDAFGFDNGTRDAPFALAAALNSGRPILEGADFSRTDLQDIAVQLNNARTSVLQKSDAPVNFSGNITGGGSWDVGSTRFGLIATLGIDNKWRTRETLQQLSLNADLSGDPQTSFDRVITDNRVVVNGLIGPVGRIRRQQGSMDQFVHSRHAQTGAARPWYRPQPARARHPQTGYRLVRASVDRHAIDRRIQAGRSRRIDLRGSYANSQREAPYERSFTYVRTNQATDPVGDSFVNDLGGNRGDATIAFSDLNENLYSGGIDLSYPITSEIKLGAGYAYQDTSRTSVRRAFQFRAPNLPVPVQQERPDFLLSDATIRLFDIILQETSANDGTAAFDAGLRVHAGYGQLTWQIFPSLNLSAGVRYEDSRQTVTAIDLFGTGLGNQFNTNIRKDYFLPAVTLTYELAPQMQVRLNGSKTLARPQFRELIQQVYIDTDSNRTFQGNPSLVNSRLTNAEARYEWFFARDQRFTAAVFYKKIDRPIEAFSSILSSDITTSFANAPEADLYGVEVEAQKYFPLDSLSDGGFFATRRLGLIGNYTYTKSKIKVGPNDTTTINNVSQSASNFFRDGSPLTGQSDHLVNVQLGLEDTSRLSQQTLLLSYASNRVTTRGPSGQPDVQEKPGFRLDFVARQAITIAGIDSEVKFEARNITATKYQEFQQFNGNRIFFNLYDVGASFSLGLGVKF